MRHQRIAAVLRQTHWNVELALFSMLIAGLVLFVVLVLPRMPQARAKYEAERAAQIEAEHDFYCRRWRMTRGSEIYRGCMADLQRFRRSVEKQLAEDFE